MCFNRKDNSAKFQVYELITIKEVNMDIYLFFHTNAKNCGSYLCVEFYSNCIILLICLGFCFYFPIKKSMYKKNYFLDFLRAGVVRLVNNSQDIKEVTGISSSRFIVRE